MMQSTDWIRYSGLAEQLGVHAWAIMREIMDQDCRDHPRTPGEISRSIDSLAKSTGMKKSQALSGLKKLKRLKYIRVFIPDNFFEDCVIKIMQPLKTPKDIEDLLKEGSISQDSDCRYSAAAGKPMNMQNGVCMDHGEGRGMGDEKSPSPDYDEAFDFLCDAYLAETGGNVSPIDLSKMEYLAKHYTLKDIKIAWQNIKKWKNRVTISQLQRSLIFPWKKFENKKKKKRNFLRNKRYY